MTDTRSPEQEHDDLVKYGVCLVCNATRLVTKRGLHTPTGGWGVRPRPFLPERARRRLVSHAGADVSDYYDRAGNAITMEEWSRTFRAASDAKKDGNGRHVGYDEENHHLISTVWLGLDHSFGNGPPLIFETMIFCHHDPPCALSEQQWRYSTEEQAAEGHGRARELVAEFSHASCLEIVPEAET